MKEQSAPAPRYTDYGAWLHIEVPAGSSLAKELRSFFKPDVLSRANSPLAPGWESFVIGDAKGFTTALELARWHFPAIVQVVPETSNIGTSTASADAEKGASIASTTRAWYVQSGIPLPDENEAPF